MTAITVLDTETCGLEAGVVELAGVQLEQDGAAGWRIGDGAWDTTVLNPGVPVSIEARAVHHITDTEILSSGTIEEYLASRAGLVLYADPDILLAAHNAPFDSFMMPNGYRGQNLIYLPPYSAGPGPYRRWICTYRCALHLWPDAPGHSNQVLRYWLELDVADMPDEAGATPHRALYDAWVTARLLERMLALRSVDELVRMSGQPALLTKVSFGKYKGRRWDEVDRGYLSWIIRDGGNLDAVHTARIYLEA